MFPRAKLHDVADGLSEIILKQLESVDYRMNPRSLQAPPPDVCL